MENVRGMLKVADQVVEDFKSLSDSKNVSYDVSYKILNSYDFSSRTVKRTTNIYRG